jgi:putative pyrroloquinoline-quinone binding quinoprotein/IPT/TIG domain-containing protein
MKKLTGLIISSFLLLSLASAVRGSELVFSQSSDTQSIYGPSHRSPVTGNSSEVADDFVLKGRIDRVVAKGFMWGSTDFQGVYIRIYEYGANNTPGALQQEYFLAASDPNLSHDSAGTVSANLSPAFWATGRHFISVQPLSNDWYWWSSNSDAPFGQSFYFRNPADGQDAWRKGDQQLLSNPQSDVAFSLYGAVTEAGIIDSLSATTLPRSGLLEILGTNFGGSGQVLIGGIPAPVSLWSSTRVIAYVPESAPLTTLDVQVFNGVGPSNTMLLNVVGRPAASGHVNWRFQMDAPYSMVRPAIGADGTIYVVDVFAHLYALSPDGGLKWVANAAGDKGVAVGLDGTIYVASESDIKAFNPDGSLKWTFVQTPRAFICLGVAVGPDGNIYSVGVDGLGVFSLTPAGQLRWAVPEPYNRLIVDYAEIVFAPNGGNQQLYFGANSHTRALRLDGTSVFTLNGSFQPAVGPDGSVHSALASYSPNGSLLWNFVSPYPYNTFSPADVGSTGVHYFTQNQIQLFALNTGGSVNWRVTLKNNMSGPVVDPFNSVLVLGSANTLNIAGTIQAVSAANGKDLWTVTLPPEDPTVFNPSLGGYGFNQGVSTRGRFSPDGQTVYFMTYTATGDTNTSRSFVYSLNTGGSSTVPPPPVTTQFLRSTSISLSAKILKNGTVSVSATVAVNDENGGSVSAATVAVSWRLPDGSTQNQTASTSSNGVARFSTTGRRGTYTLTVSNVTKSGYTFDRTNSVLSKTITK